MMLSAAAFREADDYPAVGSVSDGANDGVLPSANLYSLPWYDVTKDVDLVPKYTREYLHTLTTALNLRLRSLDDAAAYYPVALSKTRKVHQYLMGLLIVLGLLWLATAIVIIVAVFKGSGVGRGSD
ncbi:hypothetical protein F4859DRAFT_510261 [Xylaria cf. heliscus]|nr:hypothetical protein F4859DRAFT_510261 [Xylaria cf. heliscus]